MINIVFLVSGGGGTLRFLKRAIELLSLDFKIIGVIGDRECEALEFAKQNNIFCKKIDYSRNENIELQETLLQLEPDFIITNIHKIIDSDTLNLFPNRFINLHYSLLPAFKGLIGMKSLNYAKEQNVKFIGSTCHIVNEIVDAGNIIQQACFIVDWYDDKHVIETLFRTACICLLNSLLIVTDKSTGENKEVLINNYNVIFSPNLKFNIHLDISFWDSI